MIMGVSGTATGDKDVVKSLRFVARGVKDFRPLWRRIELDFYTMMDERFAMEGARGGESKWQELSPAYARRKAAQYPGRGILEATGALRDSLAAKGGQGRVLAKTEREMQIGTSIPYAVYHQRGGPRLPRREIVVLGPDDERGWNDIAQEWIDDLAREAGLR